MTLTLKHCSNHSCAKAWYKYTSSKQNKTLSICWNILYIYMTIYIWPCLHHNDDLCLWISAPRAIAPVHQQLSNDYFALAHSYRDWGFMYTFRVCGLLRWLSVSSCEKLFMFRWYISVCVWVRWSSEFEPLAPRAVETLANCFDIQKSVFFYHETVCFVVNKDIIKFGNTEENACRTEKLYRWLSARLQQLHCQCTGVTTVLHKAIEIDLS